MLPRREISRSLVLKGFALLVVFQSVGRYGTGRGVPRPSSMGNLSANSTLGQRKVKGAASRGFDWSDVGLLHRSGIALGPSAR